MNGSIGSYTGNGLTNKPYTMKDYANSAEAKENLYRQLKELTEQSREKDVEVFVSTLAQTKG